MSEKFWWAYGAFFAFIFPLFFSYVAEFPSSALMATIALVVGIILWIIFMSQTYKQLIGRPKSMKDNIASLLRNGRPVQGEIIDKAILARGQDQMESLEVIVQFQNLSGTMVTHDFQFIDSKPHQRRFEVGNSIKLRLNTTGKSPVVITEGSEAVFNPKMGIIALLLLVVYMIGTFIGHYYFFSNGTGWRFLSLWHPWLMTPIIGLFFMVLMAKVSRGFTIGTANLKQQEQLLLYGKPATAIIQRADQTGTYINEQPQIKFILNFNDERGQSHVVTFKKVVPLTQLHIIQKGEQHILYLPDNPQVISFV